MEQLGRPKFQCRLALDWIDARYEVLDAAIPICDVMHLHFFKTRLAVLLAITTDFAEPSVGRLPPI
jgi:hypothetical protein